MQSLSQHARLISIETPFEAGALIIERFSGREAISELFRFEVDCLATSTHFELKALAGEEVSLRLSLADGSKRSFHGIVTCARQLGSDGNLARYRLTLEPWAHSLTLRRDSYVYQDMSVLEIVADVFSDYQMASYRFDVRTEIPKRSLTMQYRESDYAFVTRLLAEEGLNFFFAHADNAAHISTSSNSRQAAAPEQKGEHARHQLVVFDDNAALTACKQPAIRFHRADATEESDSITLFSQLHQVQANMVALGSWDYKKLAATTCEDTISSGNCAQLEVFEGIGAYRYTDTAESARIVRARTESLALTHQMLRAESSARALMVGSWFSLSDHPDANGEYAVLSITHRGANNLSAGAGNMTGQERVEPGSYRNQFTCVAHSTQIRPPFWHPKPTAPGTQVALVVGLRNEEITTERDHRIKVQFPWQRDDGATPGQLPHPAGSNASGNETAGTWVRVAEPAAGANWGTHFVPRIGQEVCIDFIAGDIDRPVVTGQLYNDADIPAFHGGDNHPGALAGIQSKEYAANGFNQWLIDDTPNQLRHVVATSYATTQLNAGYLIRQNNNTRSVYRGTGFEFVTDAWSSLRAKRGIFISTTQRNCAVQSQLDTQEAQKKFKAAEEMGNALSNAAARHHALPLSNPKGIQQLVGAITAAEAADGTSAPKFEKSVTLIDSHAAVSLATPATSVIQAAQDMTIATELAMRITGGQTVSVAAARSASLFTQTGGAKAIAAKEPVSVRAHAGPMDILADKAITITSSNANIKIEAKQEILLASGGGFIRLAGNNINIHCPASISIKGITHAFLGAGGKAAELKTLPA
ncbi:MAG TPA: type VI secretion system Vgr family protein [Noviherbaspirillum sp.]|nr:type VI secretion system Vgr family protein [Noviherbaspirillum sp.]